MTKTHKETRPPLQAGISVQDFRDFYWLKSELIEFCRAVDLPRSGSKTELTENIAYYLETGKRPPTKKRSTAPIRSETDWQRGPLHIDTLITSDYRNTEQVRAFFTRHLGPRFSFNIVFMKWMKDHVGHTLADAIAAWQKIDTAKKQQTTPKQIAPQFEYNRYMRDILADNPHLTRPEAIALWKIKKAKRGSNQYQKTDLAWLK